MPLDVEKYRRFVDHLDLSDNEKIELILIVGQYMENCVDSAFRDDSVQHALALSPLKNAMPAPVVINCETTPEQSKLLAEIFSVLVKDSKPEEK